jgi:hypothetical protein
VAFKLEILKASLKQNINVLTNIERKTKIRNKIEPKRKNNK